MLDKADIRATVATELAVAPDAIGYDEDLVGLGLQSMTLMRLAGRWRKQGYAVRTSELVLAPTIAGWAALLAASSPDAARPTVLQPPAAEPVSDPNAEFALATMQHAYWVGRRRDQSLGGVAAHLYVEFDGTGLDVDRLDRAVAALLRRHDMLRAQFLDSGTQRIVAEPRVPSLRILDLSHEPDSYESTLETVRQSTSHQRMDVAAGQVVDIAVTMLPHGRHRLHVDVDMLAADAQSYRTVLGDLAALYHQQELTPVGYSYRDYLSAKHASAEDNSGDREWWESKVRSLPDVPALPIVPESDRVDPSRSVRFHHWISPEAKANLYRSARAHVVTPALALASVFGEVVARWSAQQNFLLNVPLFDREALHDDVDRLVGDFTNSVLVEVDARTTESIAARTTRLQRELHTSASHAAYEGLDVLRDLGRLRGAPVTPSVVFTSGLDLGELFSDSVVGTFGEPVWILSQGPQVDLDAQVAELDGGLLVNWDVRRDALPAGVADAMFDSFRALLELLAAPDSDWSAPLSVDLPAEQRAVRDRVNDTAVVLENRTLHDAFFAAAVAEPGRPALLWHGGSSTYGELATQALSVARALIDAGVRPGDTVAIVVPKGHNQIRAVLGVLAAGATYLPIGVDQPRTRRDRILARGGVRVAIVDAVGGALPEALPTGVSAVDLAAALAGDPLSDRHSVSPDSVAYVLFTSGSTGEPKGVEVSHRAATNTIDAIATHFDIGSADRLIALSALEFDLSVFDIFCPLSRGGALVCVDAAVDRDASAWAGLVAEHAVTVVNCAPGLVGMLLDAASVGQLSSVRVVLTGGDRVTTSLAARARATVPGLRFAGLGGTTETAIHSTVSEVTDTVPGDVPTVPYGTPLANVACRVVNERGEDCPDWVVGELWIGGESVADGYRGDADRTADRFVRHDGLRWYRTGDLARYRPDGTLDFLGRADHQVKIRGFRVELGEIESALASLPGVRDAVALVTTAGRLTAVVEPDAGATLESGRLAVDMRDLVPTHMIPDTLDVWDSIPLTPNGKLDRAEIRRALGDDHAPVQEYVAPSTNLEAALAHIAARVLGVDRLGIDTDFFDAGGNSILATTLTAKVRGLLSAPAVGVTDVLEGRTVRSIAERVRAGEPTPERLDRVATILLDVAGIAAVDSSEHAGVS